MLDCLLGNIFVQFGELVIPQTIGIPMFTNSVPLLTDLLLHAYEADFVQ